MTKLPIEIRPASTCRPPIHSTTRKVSPISTSSSGWKMPWMRTSLMFCAM